MRWENVFKGPSDKITVRFREWVHKLYEPRTATTAPTLIEGSSLTADGR